MLRFGSGLPTELIHLLQNFRQPVFSHAPLSRRFRSAATAYKDAAIAVDDQADSEEPASSFLEEPNEQHKPISPKYKSTTLLARSILTHKRPPPLPPESNLFEDPSPEYTSRTSDTTPERQSPTAIILSFLEGPGTTDEEVALQLLKEFRQLKERIEPDERFVQVAWDRLKADQLDNFLTWWTFVPSRSAYPSKHPNKKAKEKFHDIERMLLAHPEINGDRKAKQRRMFILTKFGNLCASKGLFRWAKWTYQDLSKTLSASDFQKYWHEVTALEVTYAQRQDSEVDAATEEHKASNRLIRLRWNQVLQSMVRSGNAAAACQWALDGAPSFPPGVSDPYIEESTYLALLDALDFRIAKTRKHSELHQLLKQQLSDRLVEQYPNANRARLGQFVSEASDDNDQSSTEDGLGLQYIESLSLDQARYEIGQIVQSSPNGFKRLAANTVAGFITLCRSNAQTAPPWDIIGIPSLSPPNKAYNRPGANDSVGRDVTRLWANALMIYHLRKFQPGLAIAIFRRCFLSIGTPSQVSDVPLLGKLPFDLSNLYRVVPSRYTLTLVYTALIRLEHRNAIKSIEAIYDSFLSTSYSSPTNTDSILSNYQIPDAANFKPFIDAFCNANEPDRALQVILDMQARSIRPSIHIYTTLIGGYARIGDAEKVYTLLARLEGSTTTAPAWPELDSIKANFPAPNIITYTTIIKGFAMRRLEKLARNVQRRMEAFLGAEVMEWEYKYNAKLKKTLAFLDMVEVNMRRQRGSEAVENAREEEADDEGDQQGSD